MLRLTWTQPEDLLPHALAAAAEDGRDAAAIGRRWSDAGGSTTAAVGGATPERAPEELRRLARELLDEVDALPVPEQLRDAEPDELDAILALGAPARALPVPGSDLGDRIAGAWLGRAVGCLLGKPVEKISREGIREIGRSTGNWPVHTYFTERGLDPEIAARHPWNRRSRPTSLLENIDGMPEDDDLNFPLLALGLLEDVGFDFTTDDVARSWLASLPGGRVFTAERIAYRNLLDGYEPAEAGAIRNPFRDWIGAQIRTDVYGWAIPGTPCGPQSWPGAMRASATGAAGSTARCSWRRPARPRSWRAPWRTCSTPASRWSRPAAGTRRRSPSGGSSAAATGPTRRRSTPCTPGTGGCTGSTRSTTPRCSRSP
ncbi:hypothetical protein GCM10025866_22140 [Naasia aerilata]|uniref:ADP-ribosylglycohydrolase n=1 Tax=Naasia aerilata TaxID=1162966 RepID=A0ABN6XRU2_9MICO|nr:hypothetical protein GCM10025866_22140 [Naasia aerilata]